MGGQRYTCMAMVIYDENIYNSCQDYRKQLHRSQPSWIKKDSPDVMYNIQLSQFYYILSNVLQDMHTPVSLLIDNGFIVFWMLIIVT